MAQQSNIRVVFGNFAKAALNEGPAKQKEFEGINAVCKEIDACDNPIRLNKIRIFKVRPFKKEMSLSHFQFITEYLIEKENHLKSKK